MNHYSMEWLPCQGAPSESVQNAHRGAHTPHPIAWGMGGGACPCAPVTFPQSVTLWHTALLAKYSVLYFSALIVDTVLFFDPKNIDMLHTMVYNEHGGDLYGKKSTDITTQ